MTAHGSAAAMPGRARMRSQRKNPSQPDPSAASANRTTRSGSASAPDRGGTGRTSVPSSPDPRQGGPPCSLWLRRTGIRDSVTVRDTGLNSRDMPAVGEHLGAHVRNRLRDGPCLCPVRRGSHRVGRLFVVKPPADEIGPRIGGVALDREIDVAYERLLQGTLGK